MKKVTLFLLMVLAVSAVGCAKKTASEQMQEDMKKASDQLKKDMKSF